MFTGIIQHRGIIKNLTPKNGGLTLAIQTHFTELSLGESIAVDGVCLTVTEYSDALFYVELSQETQRVSIAGSYRVGQAVNLERAILASERFGGHFVTGHIDQTATVLTLRPDGEFCHCRIGPFDKKQQRFLIPKGSIAVNGVSLTINQLEKDDCQLMLIPRTLNHTTLADLTCGDRVNIEFDLLAKLIAKQTQEAQRENTL